MSGQDGVGRLQSEIEAAWQIIENGYDIEERQYFEREAPRNGFRYALAQAVFHIWKRDRKPVGDVFEQLVARVMEVCDIDRDSAIRFIWETELTRRRWRETKAVEDAFIAKVGRLAHWEPNDDVQALRTRLACIGAAVVDQTGIAEGIAGGGDAE